MNSGLTECQKCFAVTGKEEHDCPVSIETIPPILACKDCGLLKSPYLIEVGNSVAVLKCGWCGIRLSRSGIRGNSHIYLGCVNSPVTNNDQFYKASCVCLEVSLGVISLPRKTFAEQIVEFTRQLDC